MKSSSETGEQWVITTLKDGREGTIKTPAAIHILPVFSLGFLISPRYVAAGMVFSFGCVEINNAYYLC